MILHRHPLYQLSYGHIGRDGIWTHHARPPLSPTLPLTQVRASLRLAVARSFFPARGFSGSGRPPTRTLRAVKRIGRGGSRTRYDLGSSLGFPLHLASRPLNPLNRTPAGFSPLCA